MNAAAVPSADRLPASTQITGQTDYDLVFVTHLPSFYKINLYEQLARRLRVLAIFLGRSSTIRTPDFVAVPRGFDAVFLSDVAVERRPTVGNLWRLWRLLGRVRPRLLLVNGWELPEFWLGLLAARCHRGIVMETTGHGVSTRGVKSTVKKLALSRADVVMASGRTHADFMRRMGFRGGVFVTRGVGIINKPAKAVASDSRLYRRRFLYAGRIAPEKNLDLLFAVFHRLGPEGFRLTVAGGAEIFEDGPIQHVGYQPNERMPALFADHDFLILPSVAEPWGLVVEEAIFCRTPPVMSSACGAAELITNGTSGLILDVSTVEAAVAQLRCITTDDHRRMQAHCGPDAIQAKDDEQLQSYADALAWLEKGDRA